MNVSFVGTGNCAAVLARLCKANGHKIIQIIGRNMFAAQMLAQELDCQFAGINEDHSRDIELMIFAISDSMLQEVAKKFSLGEIPVVHTAGAVPMEVLKETSAHFGVLYPLQSMNAKLPALPSAPFIIEGNGERMLEFVRGFASTLGGRVEVMNFEKRLRLHTAAVIVNNFTNHLYTVAQAFCAEEQVDFTLLLPLIQETASRISTYSPADMQTGPAMRKDVGTLDKHLRLLTAHPKLRTLYLRLSDGIMNP